MLKTDFLVVLMLLLMFDEDMPKYISIILAFLAGLSIRTGSDLLKKTFTATGFFIRLLFVFGLSIGLMFIYQTWNVGIPIVFPIMAISLFSDFIVMLIEKYGKIWLNKTAKKTVDE